ncbi:entericidin A/B family lipoprotein [uncultured Sphingomonas sp.]|nr:entericidin A/B family lipoprotein [uncultured Sphingomonas sp.]
MIRKTLPLVAALSLLTLGACNTVNGVGKDVRSAGTAVSDASGQNHKK